MNGARAWVTYFDERYLAPGIVLLRSLRRHDPDALVFVLAFDVRTQQAVVDLAEPAIDVLTPDDLLAFEPRLAGCADRSRAAVYATQKPVLPLLVFARRPDLASVAHVDADCLFFSSPGPALDELGAASIGLSPHDFPPRYQAYSKAGPFNAGFMWWRNDGEARRALADWRDECIAWCAPTFEADGRFMNQGYLRHWPERYAGVHLFAHPGANLAWWNLPRRAVRNGPNGVTVEGRPLVFFHFSGVTLDALGIWRSYPGLAGRSEAAVRKHIFAPWLREVDRTDRELRRRYPGLLPLATGGWTGKGVPVGRGPWPRGMREWLARLRWSLNPAARAERALT